jgi:hypothetical protein
MRKLLPLAAALALVSAALAGQVTVGGKEISLTIPFCGS